MGLDTRAAGHPLVTMGPPPPAGASPGGRTYEGEGRAATRNEEQTPRAEDASN